MALPAAIESNTQVIASTGAAAKKFKASDKKATLAAKEVLAYEKALESQLEQLKKLCDTGKEEDGDEEDGIDLSDISDDSESASETED